MSKYKDIEGAVNVNGDITPVSRQPVNQITGGEWEDMSLSLLHEQRNMLYTRLSTAASICPQAMPTIRQGIAQIDAIIENKSVTRDTLI